MLLVTSLLAQVAIIPKPIFLNYQNGPAFEFNKQTKLIVNGRNDSLKTIIELFQEEFENLSGYPLKKGKAKQNYIHVQIGSNLVKGNDAYELVVNVHHISISAATAKGAFYAIQSLKQLMPPVRSHAPIKIPSITIYDASRFTWRGMHLDVSRHFSTVSQVKSYINLMAMYKMNTFHWHLTEDQGWRIEIKKYPLLTSVGAWRKGTMIGKYSDHKFDTIRYGGFYTQDEIKEVVAYANKKHITIVPEIEMPGHSVAAIASYPWLSCTGKKIEVEKQWGVFDDVYCTKDSTFKFLEDVLTEVVALFPGKYIHIGGDECPKTRWKTCKTCQNNIKKLGLKDEHELQSYFIKRMEKFLNSKGKQIIGWDEILEGGLAPNAAVMSWRGIQGGIDAAKQKHNVVMSPGKPCYFDHYQSTDTKNEPLAIGGYNPVDSVYMYEPMPKSLSEQEQTYIMGAQANVWTEYILSEKQVEYMAVPRMLALSEVLWTKPENKDLNKFHLRLKQHVNFLDRLNVNYAKHFLKQP